MGTRAVTGVTVSDEKNKGPTPKKRYDFWLGIILAGIFLF
jgi:hypothetical protein